MKFTKIPVDAFSSMQFNAGMLLTKFTIASGTYEEGDILGATTGGINASAVPTITDMGDGVDNCPVNMKELARIEGYECKVSGTLITLKAATAKKLMAAATMTESKVTPRMDLVAEDFGDIWWVGDYSDKNGTSKGGYVAIHLLNALSTGGFAIKSNDKGKGEFAFEFTGFVSITAQDTVPFEVYVHTGEAEA